MPSGAAAGNVCGRVLKALRLALLALCMACVLAVVWGQAAQARVLAAIVVDARTGRSVISQNANKRVYPASLAKMMTLYLLFDAIKAGKYSLNSKLRVSRAATRVKPSKLYLQVGDTITVHEAIQALIVKSANDVAVVVAESLGKKERRFARIMTKKARALGMRRTVFRNASGLSNRKQKTTAHDMAILARALLHNHPKFFPYFNQVEFFFRDKLYTTHNRLVLDNPDIDGMKTGYIRQSGFNVVATMQRGQNRVIAVVMGQRSAPRRDKKAFALLNSGMRRLQPNRQHRRLASATSQHATVTVPKRRPSRQSGLRPGAPNRRPRFRAAPPGEALRAPATHRQQLSSLSKPPDRSVVSRAASTDFGRTVVPPQRRSSTVSAGASPASQRIRPGTAQSILVKHRNTRRRIPARRRIMVKKPWQAQIGVFNDYTRARRALLNLSNLIPKRIANAQLIVDLISIEPTPRPTYRALITGLTETDARGICGTVRESGAPCQAVESAGRLRSAQRQP